MIRWEFEQMDLWTYWVEIKNEYGEKLFKESNMSSPCFSILKELLSDYLFAKKIYSKIFDFDNINPEDRMDLSICCLTKLEEIDIE